MQDQDQPPDRAQTPVEPGRSGDATGAPDPTRTRADDAALGDVAGGFVLNEAEIRARLADPDRTKR